MSGSGDCVLSETVLRNEESVRRSWWLSVKRVRACSPNQQVPEDPDDGRMAARVLAASDVLDRLRLTPTRPLGTKKIEAVLKGR